MCNNLKYREGKKMTYFSVVRKLCNYIPTLANSNLITFL